MKKITLQTILFVLLIALPRITNAQWHMVRWDHVNYFTKAFTATPNNVFLTSLGSSQNGTILLRSNTGGTQWDSIQLSSSTIDYQINDLFFNDANNGFMGGTKNNNQVLIKTVDNGNTWTDVTPNPLSISPINSISFIDPSNGFVADMTTIYKTNDAGVNWTPTTAGFNVKDISFTDMQNGYSNGEANTHAVVMKTNDGGQTWMNILTTNTQFFTTSSMEKLDVINENVLFSSIMYGTTIYRSLNGGATWDSLTLSQIWAIQDFDFINANEGHVLSSQGEIFGTNDGGQTWTLEYAVASGAYGPSVFLNSISFAGAVGYVGGSDGLVKKFSPSPTGIFNPKTAANISIYPNPLAKGNAFSIGGLKGDFDLEIYNSVGEIILHENISNVSEKVFTLNNVNLSKGVYTISVKNNHQLFSSKLVVIN